MEFPAAAVERAMTYQQGIMRAVAGTWTWLKAADVLGIHPRSLRRWRARDERDPVLGLQEERNGDHLLEAGAAIRCNNLPVLAWKIDRLLDDPARLTAMRARATSLARPHAAQDIATTLIG